MTTSGIDLRKATCLIVDSSRHSRAILRVLLRACGIGSIVESENGLEALDRFAERPIDLVFLEWRLPGVDGPEVLFHLRREGSRDRRVPVIVLSSGATRADIVKARDLGATEFLARPISLKTLRERILSILTAPRPFLRTADFFGPDRRRTQDAGYSGPERRSGRRTALDHGDQGVPLPTDARVADSAVEHPHGRDGKTGGE